MPRKIIFLLCMWLLAMPVFAQSTPLVIWGATTSMINATSATVVWNTNYPVAGYIAFGTSSQADYTAYTDRTSPFSTNSQFIGALPNLATDTTYYFQIIMGNDYTIATSSQFSFRTLVNPPPAPTTNFYIPPDYAATHSVYVVTAASSTSQTQTIPPVPPVNVKLLTKSLYYGLRDAEVKILQEFLIARSYLAIGNNTGFFGALTKRAVQKYQCYSGIVCYGASYGLVGPKTRNSINAQLLK